MKKWFSFMWRWSWVVTLLIACIFIYWGWVTVDRFYTFGVRYNPAPIPYHLHDSGKKELYNLFRVAELGLVSPWNKQERKLGNLKVVNLFVPEPSLAQLNSNLPHSGYDYVKGSIWNDNKLQKMKFKYRGDFVYHWGERKKSLRVKTSKKKLFSGVRTFNLIGTKQLETHFGCLLAREMGLIAPRTDLVEVTLNGKLLGVHAYVEQLEELTLRNNGWMPGDLYAGELLAKDSYSGIDSQIFNHPKLWEKLAVNNHYQEESRKPLVKFLSLVNSSDSEHAHRELTELLDIDAWGKLAAFETLTQSFHYDNTHNWRLYYDPMKSRFYPVIWDPVGWHPNWVPKREAVAQLDIIPSEMHKFLFENADILRARAQALGNFFNNGGDSAFLQKIEAVLPGLEKVVKRDPLLTDSPEEELAEIERFKTSVAKVFTDIKQGYMGNLVPLQYALESKKTNVLSMPLTVSGRAPIHKFRLSFIQPIEGPISGYIGYVVNGKRVERDISGAISINGSTVEIAKSLIARHQQITVGNHPLKKNRLQVDSAYYELSLAGLTPRNYLIDVMVDYGDGELVLAERVSSLEKTPFVDLYNIVESEPVEAPIVWQGIVDILDVREIQKPLIIKPGTVVRLAPGASLTILNRLLAEGTPERPIVFVPLSNDQLPWGALTLKGQKANGSRLKYCEFEGGSGLKGDLFEYTAMFSVHNVKGVVVENCTFRDSKITDDMVHAVYAEIRFSDCLFERSLMDALDIDISDAVIERCRFVDSGNDSIDLMTSNAVVIDTLVENGGDKAVSVGEGSKLLAINNVFRNNVIGVQAKDGSVASIYNTDLIANDHALDAYKKNWRYNDGGDIFVYKSRFEENDKMITADKKSKIRVFDSYMDRVVATTKRVKIDETVDSQSERKARTNKLDRHKKEIKSMKAFDAQHWNRVDSKSRGASVSYVE